MKTFTIGYQGDYNSYSNETAFARQVALEVGAEYHEAILDSEDMVNFLEKMVYLQDEPLGSCLYARLLRFQVGSR